MRWLMTTLVMLTTMVAGTAEAAPATSYGWPLRPRPTVTRAFDKPQHDWLPGHRGVDLAGAPGQSVLAAGAGVIAFAGQVAGKPVVAVQHPGGLRTTYEPVLAGVRTGTPVTRGAHLGTLAAGHPGCPTPACLHWGLRSDGEYLDPLRLLRLSAVRLKPYARG